MSTMLMSKPMHKPDTRHKRTPEQIERDRTEILAQWIQGRTQRELVRWIAANRPYSLSRAQVAADLTHTFEEWKEERLATIDEFVRKQMMVYAHLETRLWEAYEKSTKPRVVTARKAALTDNGKAIPTEATVTTEDQSGDMAIIDRILEVQKLKERLFGIGKQRINDDAEDETTIDAPEVKPQIVLYLPKNGRDIAPTQ